MKFRLIIALAALLASSNVFAFEAGEWFMRAGLANVAPGSSSDGIAIPALGVTPIPGTEAEASVDSNLCGTSEGRNYRKFQRRSISVRPLGKLEVVI